MEKITKNERFARKPTAYTREQDLAAQIYEHFYKKISFPMLMRTIKTKGHQFVYEIWNDVRQSNARDPIKLFMWMIGKTQVRFIEK
mgnify:CR=1 FL=1